MIETPTIISERVDDIPLLLAQLQPMGVPSLFDEYFPTHGNWQGLSLGWVTAAIDEEALARVVRQLGWRVYVTNQPAAQLSLPQAVWAYRSAYLIERGFGRLKGQPLSLTPMYLEREDHAAGLIRLLVVGLRVLTLLEFVARRRWAVEGTPWTGLYVGNPTRAVAQPTAERLLEAFQEVTLTVIQERGQKRLHLTPLTPLQPRILPLLDFPMTIYTRLCVHFPQPP
jgi:hypothetical protein